VVHGALFYQSTSIKEKKKKRKPIYECALSTDFGKLWNECTYHSKNLYPKSRASRTHSSAVRCGSLLPEPDAAAVAAEDADAGTNPTLYVPNPIAGWGVPSRNGIVGQERRVCFCWGDHENDDDDEDDNDVILRLCFVVLDESEVERELINATRVERLIRVE
jgi:hypothetical protein